GRPGGVGCRGHGRERQRGSRLAAWAAGRGRAAGSVILSNRWHVSGCFHVRSHVSYLSMLSIDVVAPDFLFSHAVPPAWQHPKLHGVLKQVDNSVTAVGQRPWIHDHGAVKIVLPLSLVGIAADGYGDAHVSDQPVHRTAADVASTVTVDHLAAWRR